LDVADPDCGFASSVPWRAHISGNVIPLTSLAANRGLASFFTEKEGHRIKDIYIHILY
jgi:hypothetical protein